MGLSLPTLHESLEEGKYWHNRTCSTWEFYGGEGYGRTGGDGTAAGCVGAARIVGCVELAYGCRRQARSGCTEGEHDVSI